MKNSALKRLLLFVAVFNIQFSLFNVQCSMSCLHAQHLQAALSHYTTDNGMPSNAVSSLLKDDYGYVWLVTWNGISRFDGYHFFNYRTGKASGIRGLHNRVDNMTIDQSQNIWLKMYDGRIFVINRQTDKIEDPLEGVSGHDEYHVDYFFNPYVTSSGDVLIFFNDIGLYRMRLGRSGLKSDLIVTGKLRVNCVVEGYHSDFWVGTDKGVHRINMSNLSIEKEGYFENEYITDLATNGYNIYVGTKSGKILQFSYGQEPTLIKDVGRELTSLYIDSHGVLWFSDLGDGVYRLRLETGDVKFFSQRVLVPEYTSRGAEFNEAIGVLWIRMNHGGYGYYNRETDEMEYFHNDPSNPWNLSNTVNAHLEMNDGVVWESTIRRGLEKLEVQKNTIERHLLMPNSSHPMENEIRAMCYDQRRHLTFLANKKGSLFVFNDAHQHIGTITHDSNGNPFSRPYGMSMDSKGNYWLCDKDNGVFKITPNGNGSYHIINIRHDDNDPNSLSHDAAYQAVEDHQGNIWIATYGGGVNILKQDKAGNYTAMHAKNSLKRYPVKTYQKVRTIAVAKDGSVWAGTTDGILIMSINKNGNVSVERLKEPESLEDGLQSSDVVYLTTDKEGNMWVGTNSGGLSCAKKQDENGAWLFENFGVKNGLPTEEIRSITFDNDGNGWIGTDHILCSFNVKKKIFTAFSNLDGVDDTMLSEGAAISANNGNILFGTLNGYYVVDRSKLTAKKGSLLRLHITDFFLNDELQSPRLTNTYDYYVPESRIVTIPNHSDAFSFRFAALNYQLQHRVHYQYKLNGYDNDWRNAGKDRTATYEDIPAGTYQFQVKAFLLESPDNFDIRTIEVVVPPLFIFSPAAIWIYIFLLSVCGIGGLWWYQERLRKQSKAQKKTEKEASGRLQTDEEKQVKEEPKPIKETQPETDVYEIIE